MVYREVLYKETKREAQDGTKIRQSVPPCQKDSSHQRFGLGSSKQSGVQNLQSIRYILFL